MEKDPQKAVSLYRAGYERNYSPAACALGLCYELGIGVERDFARAAALYQEAAERRHPRSTALLANCYEQGRGVERNLRRAAELYRRAADSGYDPAAEALKRVEERLSRPLWKRLLGFLGR